MFGAGIDAPNLFEEQQVTRTGFGVWGPRLSLRLQKVGSFEMTLFFCFSVSLFITILLLPTLIRFAAPLGLLDHPNNRKVHEDPIPRCGGIAIAVALLLATLIWVDWSAQWIAILGGCAVVSAIGFLDDRRPLSSMTKLAAQFLAASILVWGGVTCETLPFLGLDPVHPALSTLFTIVFVVAITNAVNLSDGLDGLAAGSTLVSLAAITALSFGAETTTHLIVIAALTGGILGFLRFNTHPAIVFLGDGGSYLLGFSVAALTVLLLSDLNTAASPALLFLIPGVPLIDMLWVATDRIIRGRSPFAPDRSHLHHKLLEFGLNHHDAVGIYYLIHIGLTGSAFALAYEADWLIVSVFAGAASIIVTLRVLVERTSFRFRRPVIAYFVWERAGQTSRGRRMLLDITASAGLAAYFLLSMIATPLVSTGVSIIAIAIIGTIIAALAFRTLRHYGVIRFCIHGATVLVVYVSLGQANTPWFPLTAQFFLLSTLLALIILSMRWDGLDQFRVTTLDTLILIFVTTLAFVLGPQIDGFPFAEFVIKLAILIYVAEYIFRGDDPWPKTVSRYLTGGTLFFCLTLIAVRGFLT